MKILQTSVFRAVCAVIIGALLVKYRDEMVTWLTISIGVLFALSGIISCISYMVQKKRFEQMERDGITLLDSTGRKIRSTVSFPIVGIGSVVLGLILAFKPDTFIAFGSYLFAALIILGSLSQFMKLVTVSQYGKVNWLYWIMPIVLLLTAVAMIIYPTLIASAPFFFIGWCLMIYGIVEIINSFKVTRLAKKAGETGTVIEEVLGEEGERQ